jgi:hypothetical protein
LFEDCSASWVVQRRVLLTTDDDEALFFEFLNVTSVDELSDYVRSMVSHASLATGRPMRVEHFEVFGNVSETALGREGILQYQFVWVGFAEEMEGEKIKVGDVLGGELDLSSGDLMVLIYPNGYFPSVVYPLPDKVQYSEQSLTWFGPRNFGMGEPTIILEMRTFNWTELIVENLAIFLMIFVAFFVGFLGYFLGKRRRNEGKRQVSITEAVKKLTPLEVEGDEEKILRLLSMAGGSVLQSTIVKHFGFSKSKVSTVLSSMERKGLVTRKKTGRGKIVTLVKKEK